MSSENTKTLVWLVVASVMSLLAFLNLPKAIELESQAKVNEPMFVAYQASNVWQIDIQKSPTPDYRAMNPNARVEELTVKRTANRGWELAQFFNYPAENIQRIGQLTTMLNDLKILEVINESASDTELAEFGLLSPDAEGASENQKATRLKLSGPGQEIFADILVGRDVPKQGQAAATVYVRPANENAIYRVSLDKRLLSTSLVDILPNGNWLTWVNANPLGIQTSANIPATGPAFRVVDRVIVESTGSGRTASDPYRATFRFGENVSLLQLATLEGQDWKEVPREQLPTRPEFTQAWRIGMEALPAFFFMHTVKKKSDLLQQTLKRGTLAGNADISEIEELGFTLGSEEGETQLIGPFGHLVIEVQGGLKFRLVFGSPNEIGLIPMIVQASLTPTAIPQQPVLGQLPAEAEEWPADQRDRELENLRREHNRKMEDWNRIRRQLTQDLEQTNERLLPWIYLLPVQYAETALPNIRLIKTASSSTGGGE